jgi:hypothetical protein
MAVDKGPQQAQLLRFATFGCLTSPTFAGEGANHIYNSPLGLLRPEHCGVNTEQLTRAVARQASLWHQPEHWASSLCECFGRSTSMRVSTFAGILLEKPKDVGSGGEYR